MQGIPAGLQVEWCKRTFAPVCWLALLSALSPTTTSKTTTASQEDRPDLQIKPFSLPQGPLNIEFDRYTAVSLIASASTQNAFQAGRLHPRPTFHPSSDILHRDPKYYNV